MKYDLSQYNKVLEKWKSIFFTDNTGENETGYFRKTEFAILENKIFRTNHIIFNMKPSYIKSCVI